MEKIEKNKTQEKIERLTLIVELADKCHRLGLIDNYGVTVDVSTEVDYSFDVRIDKYTNREHRWTDQENSYLTEQPIPVGDPEEMVSYLQGLIAARKAALLAELEIVEG